MNKYAKSLDTHLFVCYNTKRKDRGALNEEYCTEKAAEVVQKRRECRSGYCGVYPAGSSDNIRSAVVEIRSAIIYVNLSLYSFCTYFVDIRDSRNLRLSFLIYYHV